MARRCEDLGYSSLLLPDHFGDQLAPFVALTVAAEATSSLRVGTLVADNDYRHPVVVAKEAMTLDLMSEGRFELGLGAGWLRTDYEEAGIAYDDPKVRVARMEEAISVVKGLWGAERFSYEGQHYRLAGAQGLPRPHRPSPLLAVGGGGRKVLSVAGREADIVGINPSLRSGTVDATTVTGAVADLVDQRVGWVREAAGERFARLELQILTRFAALVDDAAGLAEQLAPSVGLTAEQALASPSFLVGTLDEVCERLEERRERWGLSYIVLHQAELEIFAPVVARLAGQ